MKTFTSIYMFVGPGDILMNIHLQYTLPVSTVNCVWGASIFVVSVTQNPTVCEEKGLKSSCPEK
jgi:hypothetical protein